MILIHSVRGFSIHTDEVYTHRAFVLRMTLSFESNNVLIYLRYLSHPYHLVLNTKL